MFIKPTKPNNFKAAEPKIEDIKTYVQSNTQHIGDWFSTTLTARKEMYGPADVVMKKYSVENVNVSSASDINSAIEILSNEVQPKVTIGKGTYSPAYPEN